MYHYQLLPSTNVATTDCQSMEKGFFLLEWQSNGGDAWFKPNSHANSSFSLKWSMIGEITGIRLANHRKAVYSSTGLDQTCGLLECSFFESVPSGSFLTVLSIFCSWKNARSISQQEETCTIIIKIRSQNGRLEYRIGVWDTVSWAELLNSQIFYHCRIWEETG